MADLEKIWAEVKSFYEKSYLDPKNPNKRFRFRQRPSDILLMYLYKAMERHKADLSAYFQGKPEMLDRYLKFEERKRGSISDDKK